MPRKYEKVQELLPIIKARLEEGKTQREIAEEFGLKDKYVVKHPYCAWQKGSNENSNGLLREFYPKGRNLSRVTPATLKRNLALINARPRKVLNFHSAQSLWDLELLNCCT